MAMRDWNRNGDKNDPFDNYMDYKLYQKWKEKQDKKESEDLLKNNKSSSSSDILFNIAAAVIVFTILFAASLERDFLLSLIGWSEYSISSLSGLDKLFTLIIVLALDIIVLVLIIGIILSISYKIKQLKGKK